MAHPLRLSHQGLPCVSSSRPPHPNSKRRPPSQTVPTLPETQKVNVIISTKTASKPKDQNGSQTQNRKRSQTKRHQGANLKQQKKNIQPAAHFPDHSSCPFPPGLGQVRRLANSIHSQENDGVHLAKPFTPVHWLKAN